MKPCFHTLYRRRELDHNRQQKVFAVAAIAFCLRHDEDFRESFLKEFCGLRAGLEATGIEIDADTRKFADLGVSSKDIDAFACVLEFKIRSDVQPHQNPELPQFEGEDGYGKKIVK